MKIKEFIYIVNNKVFRVYSKDKQEAKKTIIKTASEYSKTDNDYYRKHWVDIVNSIVDDNYTMVQNTDFLGIREVI
jgi:hypothetical protein